jgi:2'-5' RNA ligase
VTLLYPFISPEQIEEKDIDALAKLFAANAFFELVFKNTARFTDVVYLQPLPDKPVLALIQQLMAAYPDYPPYGGKHLHITPHLTIAQADDGALLEKLDVEISDKGRKIFPIQSLIREATLYIEEDGQWSPRTAFPLDG